MEKSQTNSNLQTQSAMGIYCETVSANAQVAKSDIEGKNLNSSDACEMSRDIDSLQVCENSEETTKKPLLCEFCGKIFFNYSRILNRHRRMHTGEKLYKCSECQQEFSYSSTLNRHRAIHTGEKPYKCSECPREFSQSFNLTQHKKTHFSEKPYKCRYCPRKFTRACSAIRHRNEVHLEIKLFSCKICKKKYFTKAGLNYHLTKRHDSQYRLS